MFIGYKHIFVDFWLTNISLFPVVVFTMVRGVLAMAIGEGFDGCSIGVLHVWESVRKAPQHQKGNGNKPVW
jgi:hypothetical protein